ncbi:MAG: hypothetical protein JNG84_02355, partial [Archangium sp.]|nr:hypothetical protein [Archangium sp.]
CSEAGTSCLAEVGNALGVDGLVTGSVARGERGGFVISLRVLSSLNGETWVSDSGRAANEDELLDFLQQRANRFADVVHKRLGRTAPVSAGKPLRLVGWASVATGGAAAVAAAVCFGFSKSNEAALRSPTTTLTSYEQAADVAASGRGLQTASGVLTGVAVVAAGTGVVLLLTQREAPVALFGAPLVSGGALVTVGGTFP